jgi:curved DNA-binding protein CbpA
MNFYEALHLTPSATTEEIEEAYKKAARKVHPDLNQHDRLSAEARMKLLNRIRDTLTDPAGRAAYDAALAEGRDTAKVETAINWTIQESHDKATFQKRLRTTVLAALGGLTVLGFGMWYLSHSQLPQPESTVPLPQATAPTSPQEPPAATPPTSDSVPGSLAIPRKGKGPQVIQFGSSTQDVLNFMGKPDHVEEIPSQNIRILHYGQLRLVFRNGKLIPGSGVEKTQ